MTNDPGTPAVITGTPLPPEPVSLVRKVWSYVRPVFTRFKALAVALVGLGVGLYDVITEGGIDLGKVLEPVLGERMDVGRMLTTVALMVALARFAMQNKIFQSANKNGLDNPDDPQ